MYSVIVILIAWFVEMPLWLSILISVLAGVRIVWELIKVGMKMEYR